MDRHAPPGQPSDSAAAARKRLDRPDKIALIGLAIVMAAGLYLTTRRALKLSIPFADTHTYLAPGRNLLEGRGFVTRFNVVHGWVGDAAHPGLGYYNPLYGLTLAVAWHVLRDASYLSIATTVFPCLLNAVLIFLLVRPTLGRLVGVMSAAGYLTFPSTYVNIGLIGAEHPLVTICLIVLLMVQRLVPRSPRYWALVGVVLGIGGLVKVTILAVAPALVAGLAFTKIGPIAERIRRSIGPALLLVAGIAVILVPFNLMCLTTTGKAYPEYPSLAKNWSMSVLYGGEFVEGSPAVRPDPAGLPSVWGYLGIIGRNLGTMSMAVLNEIWVLMLLIVVALWVSGPARTKETAYLFCVGGAFLAAYAVAFYWLPLGDEPTSPRRYALHTAAFWYPLGVAGLVHLVNRLRFGEVGRGVAAVALWGAASLPAWVMLGQYQHLAHTRSESRSTGLKRTMDGCRKLTGPDDLIAVGGGSLEMCGTMFLERPVVVLPSGEMDNLADVRRFMEIFKPVLVVPASCHAIFSIAPKMGYELVRIPSYKPNGEPLAAFKRGRSSSQAGSQVATDQRSP